ncbi:MAG: PDZ domain-containing protein, partial [Planctomycetes bacterium]|nr:PDZ domain-containing protein [Planctomycetota bacterium]
LGDVIVSVAGQRVRRQQDLLNALGGMQPGDQVELVVLRDRKEVGLKVVLDQGG